MPEAEPFPPSPNETNLISAIERLSSGFEVLARRMHVARRTDRK
jgi:hypothetical protein